MARLLRFARFYGVVAARTAYALTAGLRHRANRALVYDLAKRFGFHDHPARSLPQVAADEIAPAEAPIVLPVTTGTDGNVSLLELIVLSRLVRHARTVFEIGTFDGRTTVTLAANAPQATIYTLDLPAGSQTAMELSVDDRRYVEKPESGAWIKRTSYASRIRQLYGDSATFDFSRYTADFVFVDGAHSYEYVMSDSARALAMVRGQGGIIVWHDYGEWEGVTLALNELSGKAEYPGMQHVAGTTLVVARIPA
jgi:hypothetical protein